MKFTFVAINTTVYTRESRYSKPIKVKLKDGNIIGTVGNMLPGTGMSGDKQFIQFIEYQYSPIYNEESDGKVNTRFVYNASGSNQKQYVYAKLNLFQRWLLYLMRGDSLLQTSGNFKWIIGTVLVLITVYLSILTYQKDNKVKELEKEKKDLQDSIRKIKKANP
jgi:hypothetical protein